MGVMIRKHSEVILIPKTETTISKKRKIKMQYKVIVEDATQGLMGGGAMESASMALAEKVNESIGEGWEPLGGIAHSEDRQENPYLLQAMINRNARPVEQTNE
jgi:hypothetical protein